MFCPSCGTKNNYYHRYCFHCGAKLSTESKEKGLQKPGLQDNQSQEKKDLDSFLIDSRPMSDETTDMVLQEPEPQQQESEKVVPLIVDPKNEFDNDSFLNDLSYDEEDRDEFDLRSQIPLRRYHKDVKDDSGDGLQTLIKACISIVLIALIGFLVYVGYNELIKDKQPSEPIVKRIDLQYSIDELTTDDGNTGRKITILTSNGEQVKLNGKTVPVIDGRAEVILMDSEFNLEDYEQQNGALQVALDLLIEADGYPNRLEEIEFEIPVHTAPLTILSPSGKEAVVDSNSYQLIIEVQPGSEVFIDDNNYSHMVNEQGQLSVHLEVPDQPETRYAIRVSAKGFEDAYDEIVFRKRQMEFPLVVKQSVPIRAGQDEWVEITGNTHPEAVLTSNLEMKETPVIDPITGDFTLYVKATAKGYTPFELVASLEDKEDSILDLVIERSLDEREYTSTAWAAVYDELKQFPNLHNGIAFAFTGTVTEINATGTKYTIVVDIAAEGQPEQLIQVDYWGQFSFTMGQKIRVFGNFWGSKNGLPYILAPYIYR
jgi:hypothetical protein